MKKQRLLMLFAFMFLAGMMFAAEIQVASGESIQDAIDGAADGDVIVLEDGGYYEGSLEITKSLTIKTADGYTSRAIISTESNNHFTYGETPTGAEVIFKGLEFKGIESRYLHRLEPGDSLAYLEMTDVVAHGYDRCIIRASNATAYMDSVLIDNCYFYNFSGGDYRLFYLDEDGPLKYFKAVNSTFDNFDRTFLQLKSAVKKTVIIDHCNIHRRIDSRDDDLFEIRGEAGSSLLISNCIISDIRAEKIWDIADEVADSIMNVMYYNINNVANMTGNTWSYSSSFTEADPMFSNAPAGALYLDAASPAMTASATGGPIGDPKWATVPHAASLLRLTTDVGTLSPSFDKEVLAYTSTLPYGTDSVMVDAVANFEAATIAGTGKVEVTSGSGTASVVVTGGDASTQTYTIDFTVAPPSTDASLSSMMVFSALDTFDLVPVFDPGTIDYTLNVPAGTDTVFVEAEVNDDNASMVVSDTVDVQSGSGVATVVVTAQDGTTTKTYTVNITVSASGVKLRNPQSIVLHHNRASDQLRMFNASDVERVDIYSLTGKLVSSVNVNNQELLDIPTGNLVNGLYLVRMKLSENRLETGKFIKF